MPNKPKRGQKQPPKEPNWLLRVIASLIILLNIALLVVAISNYQSLGWLWTTVLCTAGVSSIALSIEAIRTNEPAWLLLDLILPN